jgi:predicted Zn-dependent protease
MADKTEKKKKWDFPIGFKPVTQEEADDKMEKVLKAIGEKYKDVPKEDMEKGARKVHAFIQGKVSWAELFNFTPEMLYQIAEYGFAQYKTGRYQDAERIFKVLTVLEWNNPYYHSVMGSILQKQKRHGEAIAEYSQAIELDSHDIVSLTNRGEILMQHGLIDEAVADLKKSAELDVKRENKFSNRARHLLQQIDVIKKTDVKKGGKK